MAGGGRSARAHGVRGRRALLRSALVVGVFVYVLWGWRKGKLRMGRARVAASLVFAALDVLVPAGLLFLVWLALRSLGNLMT